MRSSRSRIPARLRPNGERTSVYISSSETAKKPNTTIEERHLVGEVDAELAAARRRLMPLSPPVSEFQR